MVKSFTLVALSCALPSIAHAQPALDRVADAYMVHTYAFEDDPSRAVAFGNTMAALSDLTGDGVLELVVDRPLSNHIRVINPANGAVIDTIGVPALPPDPGSDYWTLRGSIADIDGDGLRDILGVREDGNSAVDTLVALSGTSPWSVIWTKASEILSTIDPGDLDGDGIPDVVCTGSVELAGGGSASGVFALSGADGSILWSNSAGGSVPVTPTPDVTGDGVPEIAVGGGSPVRILNGASGALVREIPSLFDPWDFGLSIATIPDTDGDGVDDLAIAMPRQNFGPWQKRAVIVHSLVDGAPLELIYSNEWNSTKFGHGIFRVGDMTGDGVDEFIINDQTPPLQYAEPRSALLVYDGATRDLLWVIDNWAGFNAPDNLGGQVVGVGDIDGDGAADFAASMRGLDIPTGPLAPHTPTLYVYAPASVCSSDLNADGVTDAVDLGILLANWGDDEHDWDPTTGRHALAGNIDMSARVDGEDLGYILAHWGLCR